MLRSSTTKSSKDLSAGRPDSSGKNRSALADSSTTLRRSSPLYWFALIPGILIILIGINFILNPVGASAAYGIPIKDPSAFPFMWVKGIRDIFSGAVILWAFNTGSRKNIAQLLTLSTGIAVGDGFVILGQLGWAKEIWIHWGTAGYMGIVCWFLHR